MKTGFLLILLVSFASAAFAENIIPPKDADEKTVNKDMNNCLNMAMRVADNDGELLKGLDKEFLQGHSTSGYLFEPAFSHPHTTQLQPDGTIAPRESLFNGLESTKRSDPYVVCLLVKGYRWRSSQESGLEMLQRMADQGNPRAQTELGKLHYQSVGKLRNNSLAFNLFSASAAANDADGQFNLAILYAQGDGVLPDDNIAAQWLKKAADNGHLQAKRALPMAEKIADERNQEKSAATANTEALRVSAESGNLESELKLANLYIEGVGVSQDVYAAIAWYKKAAEAGSARGLTQIGVLYDKGRGVPVDYVEAIKWYQQAAEKGDAQAQYNLGIFIYYGVGIDKNEEQGKNWIRRAADQKNQHAIDALTKWD